MHSVAAATSATAATPSGNARAADDFTPATISYTTMTPVPLPGTEQYPPPYGYPAGYQGTSGDPYQQQRLSGYGQISYDGAAYYPGYAVPAQSPNIPPPAYDNKAYTTSVMTIAPVPNSAAQEASTAQAAAAAQASGTATTTNSTTQSPENVMEKLREQP